jgi:hypothetical protein
VTDFDVQHTKEAPALTESKTTQVETCMHIYLNSVTLAPLVLSKINLAIKAYYPNFAKIILEAKSRSLKNNSFTTKLQEDIFHLFMT